MFNTGIDSKRNPLRFRPIHGSVCLCAEKKTKKHLVTCFRRQIITLGVHSEAKLIVLDFHLFHGIFLRKQSTCIVIKGRADAILNHFFYWLIKLDVAVTRRILLWCNEVTLCLRFCLSASSKKSKLQRLSRSDCMNVNPHLMVLGQNILGPHAWGESGEGPARSWCVGA